MMLSEKVQTPLSVPCCHLQSPSLSEEYDLCVASLGAAALLVKYDCNPRLGSADVEAGLG